MNQTKEEKDTLAMMSRTQRAWDKSFPSLEGDVPDISFRVGFTMGLNRKIKKLASSLQLDWEKWQPKRYGEYPNHSFEQGYIRGLA